MLKWLRAVLGNDADATAPGAATRPENNALPASPQHPAHLALLAKFRYPNDPATIAQPYWNQALPEPVETTISQFRKAGWLVDAPWQEVFEAHHRVDQLKDLLRERGLRLSGKKADMVARLAEADPEAMRKRVASIKAWTLSEAAREVVERHVAASKAAEEHAQRTALAALQAGRVAEAADAIVAFERTRLFPRGMGIDWQQDGIRLHLIERAQAILQASPGILREVPEQDLQVLRPIAALLELTGETRAGQWIPAGTAGHPRLDIEVVTRMLLFHGSNATELVKLRQAGFGQVVISGCGEDSCTTCRTSDGKVFPLDRVPELPHPACTHPMGCRCFYGAHLER